MEIHQAISEALSELGIEGEEIRPGTLGFNASLNGDGSQGYIEVDAGQDLCQFFLYSNFNVPHTYRADVFEFLNGLNISPLMDIGHAELKGDHVRYRAALITAGQEAEAKAVQRIIFDAIYCMERIEPRLFVVASSHGQRAAHDLLRELYASAEANQDGEAETPD